MTEKVVMQAEDTETIWNYSKFHVGEWPEMYTTDKTVMKRYERFALKHPDYCRLIREDIYSMVFTIHPKCMGLYPRAPRKGPVLTEEQKQVNAERLEQLRNAKSI